MRISDWSSDVCSSDLNAGISLRIGDRFGTAGKRGGFACRGWLCRNRGCEKEDGALQDPTPIFRCLSFSILSIINSFAIIDCSCALPDYDGAASRESRTERHGRDEDRRSEEHTSELQSLMRISYAVFCLKKKKLKNETHNIECTE